MAETLAQMRQRVQTLFDVNGSTVLTSTELDQVINDAYRRVWATVTSVNKTFRTSTDTFTIATGQTRALPAAFQETLFVRKDPGTEQQVYLNMFPAENGAQMSDRTYRLEGGNLVIEPLSRAPGNYDHVYIPQPPVLVNVGDQLDVELDQFKDVMALDAAIVALAREESDVSGLATIYGPAQERLVAWAAARRSSAPLQIKNVRGSRPWMWPAP